MTRYKNADKALASSLAKISAHNRTRYRAWLQRQKNAGTKLSSLCTYTSAFRKLDEFSKGRDLAQLSEHDLVAFVTWLHVHCTPSTVHGYGAALMAARRRSQDQRGNLKRGA